MKTRGQFHSMVSKKIKNHIFFKSFVIVIVNFDTLNVTSKDNTFGQVPLLDGLRTVYNDLTGYFFGGSSSSENSKIEDVRLG